MKKNILLGFFLFTLTASFSQNVTIYVVDRDDYDFSNITKTVTTQKEAETNYKTMVIVYDSFRKECIGGYGSYDDESLTKQELRKIVDNAVQDLYKGQVQIRSKNTSAQEKFKTLMTYDIKSISLDNKSVCPFNGFNHGTVDYGIYKQRGYYFAITYDNAVFGEGMTIFETVNFEYFDTLENKGMECTLDLKKFAQYSIGKNSSKLTLTEYTDTLIVYEIKKGIITLPAHIFSLHERNGYSILIATLGISLPTHNIISKSITCKTANLSNTNTLFDGEYINLSYPSNWIVDKHPKSLLADIYIGEKDHNWGTWIFRFENTNGVNFRQMMSEIENSYKEEQGVLINLIYEQINGLEWCKQDIQMNIQGNVYKQISYYCQNKNYIYNVKFGSTPSNIQKIKGQSTLLCLQ